MRSITKTNPKAFVFIKPKLATTLKLLKPSTSLKRNVETWLQFIISVSKRRRSPLRQNKSCLLKWKGQSILCPNNEGKYTIGRVTCQR